MRKLLLPLVALILLTAGCEKNHVFTYYYTVKPNQWEAPRDANGNYDLNSYRYSCWQNADITYDVIDNGFVLAYYCAPTHLDEMLPYTIYYNDNGYYYQQRIEFDIEPGFIYFILKDTDFGIDNSMQNIGPMEFKVCVYRN